MRSGDPHRSKPGLARSAGFSVVELMVAMTISLLLLAGVLSVLYTSRLTYDENMRFARLQEYARSSLELMLRDMRSSGFLGCARQIKEDEFRNRLTAPAALRYNFERPVEGFEGTSGAFAPALDTAVVPSATAGNDILVIRSVNSSLPPFVTNAAFAGGAGAVPIAKPNATTLLRGQPMLISDCRYANVFALSAAVGAGTSATLARATGAITPNAGDAQMPQNLAASLPAYGIGSHVTAIETVIYYIRGSATGRGPALWRIVGNQGPQELVEGVERIEIQYGEDTNGDRLVDVYSDADDVTNWARVLSVSLAVLMRSPDEAGELAPAGQTFDMLGTTVGPFTDRRPRILFTTTATVRNRAI
jgi:type IV pilus assembly protein PilW